MSSNILQWHQDWQTKHQSYLISGSTFFFFFFQILGSIEGLNLVACPEIDIPIQNIEETLKIPSPNKNQLSSTYKTSCSSFIISVNVLGREEALAPKYDYVNSLYEQITPCLLTSCWHKSWFALIMFTLRCLAQQVDSGTAKELPEVQDVERG